LLRKDTNFICIATNCLYIAGDYLREVWEILCYW